MNHATLIATLITLKGGDTLAAKGLVDLYAEVLGDDGLTGTAFDPIVEWTVNDEGDYVPTPTGDLDPTTLTREGEGRIAVAFEVLNFKVEGLKAKVEALNRRAAKLGVEPVTLALGPVFTPFRPSRPSDGEIGPWVPQYERRLAVATCKAIALDGWEFIGAIEHTEQGNLLKNFADDLDGQAYAEAAPTCDHCGTARYRKSTYILRHVDTGEIKRVGRTCLRDFTGANTPAKVLAAATWIREVRGLSEDDDGPTMHYDYVDAVEVLGYAVRCIRAEGFKPASFDDSTRGSVSGLLFPPIPTPSNWRECNPYPSPVERAEAVRVIEWARSYDADRDGWNDYRHNLKVALGDDGLHVRNLGLAVSAVSSLWKAEGREAERKAREAANGESDHVGTVGERLTLTGRFVGIKWIEGQWGTTGLVTLITDDGNVIKWFGSEGAVDKAFETDRDEWGASEYLAKGTRVTFTATVKGHGEFRGRNETKVNRLVVNEVLGLD